MFRPNWSFVILLIAPKYYGTRDAIITHRRINISDGCFQLLVDPGLPTKNCVHAKPILVQVWRQSSNDAVLRSFYDNSNIVDDLRSFSSQTSPDNHLKTLASLASEVLRN